MRRPTTRVADEAALAIGHAGVSHDLRYWLSSGLMTLSVFVVGPRVIWRAVGVAA
jgi:hypothetical protein